MTNQTKSNILIIDDDPSSINALTHILSPDYNVYATKDSWQGVELAGSHMPEVILLDVVMPKTNGYAVIAALRGSPATRDIPVIFITGKSDADDEEKGLILGASDYITKPFSSSIVKFRVKNLVDFTKKIRNLEAENSALRAKLEEL